MAVANSQPSTLRQTIESQTDFVKLLIAVAIGSTVLAGMIGYFWGYWIADDTFISLRYAERLVEGKGLTWNDGEYVEGYTNFLWVILIAGWGWMAQSLGFDLSRSLIEGSRWLGIACTWLLMALMCWHVRPERSPHRRSIMPAVGVALLVSTTGVFVIWAAVGMEQPLLALCVGSAGVATLRHIRAAQSGASSSLAGLWIAGSMLGLGCLTRPDTPLLVAGLAFAVLAIHPDQAKRWRDSFLLAALPATFFLGISAWRLWYYDALTPNTAHAKLGFSVKRVFEGAIYVQDGLLSILPLLIGLGGFFLASKDLRQRLLVPTLPAVLWLLYLIAIGGDVFYFFRHFVVVAVLLVLIGAESLETLEAQFPRQKSFIWSGVGAVSLILALITVLHPHGQTSLGRTYIPLASITGEFLHDQFGPGSTFANNDLLLAVEAAGVFPYISKMKTLDLLGLNDRYLAENKPEDFGTGWIGHELGNVDYFMRREPDIFLFGLGRPFGFEVPTGVQVRRLMDHPGFQELYQKQVFLGYEQRLITLYLRRTGPLGVRETADGLEVPGWLTTSRDDQPIMVGPGGRLGGVATPQMSAKLRSISVPKGRWLTTPLVFPVGENVSLSATYFAQELDVVPTPTQPGVPRTWVLEHPRGGLINFEISTTGERLFIGGLRLTRIAAQNPSGFSGASATGTIVAP